MRTSVATVGMVLALCTAALFFAVAMLQWTPDSPWSIKPWLGLAAALTSLAAVITAASAAFALGDNQTPEHYLRELDRSQKGSAVFARDSFFALPPRKVIRTDITYEQCISQARGSIAFKWTPQKLSPNQTECPTRNQLCAKTCVNDTCLCVNGRCV